MSRAPLEVYLTGHTWVAHRADGHDCAAETPAPHGLGDNETSAVRALIKQEQR